MNLHRLLPCLAAATLWTFSPMHAQDLKTAPTDPAAPLPIWPEGKMPGVGAAAPEKDTGADGLIKLTNISQPTLTLFKAPGTSGPVPFVVVCPGGGYHILSMTREGTEIAAWLNSIGISAAVLKYRVPDNREGAFQDIERAVRLARSHAGEWNIDPKRVGVIGFSAGGHLCVRLSTGFATDAYAPIDEADALGCRPDFAVLVYPAYLDQLDKTDGKTHLGVMAPELPVGPGIPPTLIVHTEDDLTFVPGSKVYHAALDAAGITNEFALYPTGGHGYGLSSKKDVSVWPDRCKDWLHRIGIL